MTPWLAVVGIGEDGLAGLSPAARAIVEGAEVVAGGARHLAMLPVSAAERIAWEGGFAERLRAVLSQRGRRVCVLASGDPMWFGVGATLARHVASEEMCVVPHVGAFSLAAARLGWPLHEVLALSVHARPMAALALHLAPGARLLILAEDGTSPRKIAELLREQGWDPSPMTVLERLGGPSERRSDGIAADWSTEADPLNVIAVECRPGPRAKPLSRLAGLPDDAFVHDGQMTKREVRAVTLAALAPVPGETLWDVGAGCGSVAIEWARAGGMAVALERDARRAALIGTNAARLGVPGLDIRIAAAPDGLAALADRPAAVFVGGGVSQPGLLEAAWAALPPGGRLVANAVTIEGEAALAAFHAGHGGDMLRLAVSRLKPTGSLHGWQAHMPVTQYRGVRP